MKSLGNILNRKILIVDDESEILIMISEILMSYGFKYLYTANSYQSTLELLDQNLLDLAILDIMLPDGNGFDLLREIQTTNDSNDFPILFLTAKDKDVDKIHGLGLGADDYITKPFNSKELLFRVINVLKRTYKNDTKQIILKDSVVDLEKAIVRKNSEVTNLTATEFIIIQDLFENSGRIITNDQIIEVVWGKDSWNYENSLMTHISRLRQKIELDSSSPKSLITIKGLGYQLNTED